MGAGRAMEMKMFPVRQHSKTNSQSSESSLLDVFQAFDECVSSPVGTPEPSAVPSSPWRMPQPPSPAPAVVHEAVHRCLFSSSASSAFNNLPRLIVPAAPSSSCGASPMQLPTPAAVPTERPQHKSQHEQQGVQGVQEWLASMELGLSSSRSSRGFNSAGCPPAGGKHASTGGADLPPPAFALLGLLE